MCADGTLVTWGYNNYGQLGNNSTTNSSVPVLVDRTGVLAGKTVVAISAGGSHALALCADGTLAAWGYNSSGQLGNSSTTTAKVPVLVNTSALRPGERIVAAHGGAFAQPRPGRLAAAARCHHPGSHRLSSTRVPPSTAA